MDQAPRALVEKPTTLTWVAMVPADWTRVGPQDGSTPGGRFVDRAGVEWYLKEPRSIEHAANEYLASVLYRLAGTPVPDTALSWDGRHFLSRIVDSVGWHELGAPGFARVQPEIRRHFLVDAWLANWDAPIENNIRVTADGVPIRVDCGGALLFRARGARRHLTTEVGELQTMRDLEHYSGGIFLYAGLTRTEELDALDRILAITPPTIRGLVEQLRLPASLADTLVERRAWLAHHYYGRPLPEWRK